MGREATILNGCPKEKTKGDAAQFIIFYYSKSYTRDTEASIGANISDRDVVTR